MTLEEQQAFDIWYNGRPKLTFDDARRALSSVSHQDLARKIFFSEGFEFQRWLITSGFQEFVETQSVDARLDFDGYPLDEHSPREETLEVLKRLWTWMKYNEKTISS